MSDGVRDETTEPPPPSSSGEGASLRMGSPSEPERLLLVIVRVLFLVLLVTLSMLPFVGSTTDDRVLTFDFLPLLLGMIALGVAIIALDALTPRKRLSSVFGLYLGVGAGLAAAVAIAEVIDIVATTWELDTTRTGEAYLRLAKLAIGITLCYLAVSIVLSTKDDFRLVIPYVEFAKQVRGVRPLAIDTSALIDGRIKGLAQSGFVDAPLVVPQFVIDELQRLADSDDKLKRARGRRGLSMVSSMQEDPEVDLTIDHADPTGHTVDHKLLALASRQSMRILTTDFNLNKVAQIHGVPVLNLNEVSNALKSDAIPGQTLEVRIVRHGENESQGVGYMPDGTMVVVEDAADHIEQQVMISVTNSLQTHAGRMIFGKLAGEAPAPPDSPPREEKQPIKRPMTAASSRRNPRRK